MIDAAKDSVCGNTNEREEEVVGENENVQYYIREKKILSGFFTLYIQGN